MRTYYNPTTFHDLLMNSLLGFVMLFTVAILLINPSNKDADIKTKAEFVITITWPLDYKSDVDVWLEDPAGNKAFYKQQEVGLMHIDRDDLGEANDAIWVNGQRIVYSYNQEILTIRGFIAGEWVLNIHMYSHKDGAGTEVPVTVRIDKLNPTLQTVFNETIVLKENWEEKTVAAFNMSTDGDILNWDFMPRSLVDTGTAGTAPAQPH